MKESSLVGQMGRGSRQRNNEKARSELEPEGRRDLILAPLETRRHPMLGLLRTTLTTQEGRLPRDPGGERKAGRLLTLPGLLQPWF